MRSGPERLHFSRHGAAARLVPAGDQDRFGAVPRRFESNRAEYNAGTSAGNGYQVSSDGNTFHNDRANNNGADGFNLAATASGNNNTIAQAK